MQLKCYNPRCLYGWNYEGKAIKDIDTLTCPACKYKLRLGKARLGNLPTYLPNENKKEYAEYEDPRCKVTDNLGKEWVFPRPVLKDGEST